MTALLIGTVLMGLILGRFFKVFVLVPACAIAVIIAFAGPTFGYETLSNACTQVVVMLASLQVGYFAALAAKSVSMDNGRKRLWSAFTHPLSSGQFRPH